MERKRKAPETHGLAHDIIDIPSNIVESILARLPVKSILRFRSVSKLWNQIISHPHFSNLHSQAMLAAPSSSSLTRFLIWGKPTNDSASHTFCLLNFSAGGFQVQLDSDLGSPSPSGEACIKCYCNGLLVLDCRNDDYVLWNPYTRMHKTIPSICKPEALGICHDPTTDDYKVVVINTSPKRVSVFSCKQRVWTKRSQRLKYPGRIGRRGVYVDGAYYWICTYGSSSDRHRNLLRFNGVEDTCGMLQLPASVETNSNDIVLLNLKGCLGLIYGQSQGFGFTNYHIVIREHGNSWGRQIAIKPDLPRRWALSLKERPPFPLSDTLVVIFLYFSDYIVYDVEQERVVAGPLTFPSRWKRMFVPYRHHLPTSMFN